MATKTGKAPAPTFDAVLFKLDGQGDESIFLAPHAAWKWAEGARPGQQQVPAAVREALTPFLCDDEDIEAVLAEGCQVTMGSASNDVALYLSLLCRSFKSREKAHAFAKKKGWTVDKDDYEGCIY